MMRRPWRTILCALALACICRVARCESAVVGPSAEYQRVAETLSNLIPDQIQQKGLPAVSIALVDGTKIAWAAGFGQADPEHGIAATAQSVYRVGSVSKLFTDIAVMQLVERGELSLDTPITEYLPDFQPRNPFDTAITLRQLMCHRAGLVRESPIGSYFDANEPTLESTVKSLNDTDLKIAPESKTKYSNAGIAVVGFVLERLKRQSFSDYMEHSVLGPLGMQSSGYSRTPAIASQLAKAVMWTYDGRTFPAPEFGLGTSPAGNLYSNVIDLSQFLMTLFRRGVIDEGTGQRMLSEASLEEMWKPQYGIQGDGFGLGFHVSKLDGHRRVGHGGAVYGFSTQLSALPDEKLGVVVIASKDVCNGIVSRLAEHALRLMLATRTGSPFPQWKSTSEVPSEIALRMRGRFAHHEHGELHFSVRGNRLHVWHGSHRREVRSLADGFVIDDELGYGPALSVPNAETVVLDGKTYERQPLTKPGPPPEHWQGLIGEYGWDHNTLYIRERAGKLYALIEWLFDYPLEEVERDVFAFPNFGMYHDEKLIFTRDATGRATQVVAASVLFPRRAVGWDEGTTFRIDPVRPVAELREQARAAQPPREQGEFDKPDLVEVSAQEAGIRLDVRYATTNNFMGVPFYSQPRAFLQRRVADAVVRANQRLKPLGYGLLIHDAYRPWFVTKMFYEATPSEMKHFVANPDLGSKHNRGAAVDLTLYELDSGKPVQMPSGYDEFSPRASPDYPGGWALERWHRELLDHVMTAEGFTVYDYEWWHFDHADWRRFSILNVPFEQLSEK